MNPVSFHESITIMTISAVCHAAYQNLYSKPGEPVRTEHRRTACDAEMLHEDDMRRLTTTTTKSSGSETYVFHILRLGANLKKVSPNKQRKRKCCLYLGQVYDITFESDSPSNTFPNFPTEASLTFEEVSTLLCQIEACLNSGRRNFRSSPVHREVVSELEEEQLLTRSLAKSGFSPIQTLQPFLKHASQEHASLFLTFFASPLQMVLLFLQKGNEHRRYIKRLIETREREGKKKKKSGRVVKGST